METTIGLGFRGLGLILEKKMETTIGLGFRVREDFISRLIMEITRITIWV